MFIMFVTANSSIIEFQSEFYDVETLFNLIAQRTLAVIEHVTSSQTGTKYYKNLMCIEPDDNLK